jgi:hypothetical protein
VLDLRGIRIEYGFSGLVISRRRQRGLVRCELEIVIPRIGEFGVASHKLGEEIEVYRKREVEYSSTLCRSDSSEIRQF